MCGPCKWVEEHSPPLVGAAAARVALSGPFMYQICLLYDCLTVSLSIGLFNASIPKIVLMFERLLVNLQLNNEDRTST